MILQFSSDEIEFYRANLNSTKFVSVGISINYHPKVKFCLFEMCRNRQISVKERDQFGVSEGIVYLWNINTVILQSKLNRLNITVNEN